MSNQKMQRFALIIVPIVFMIILFSKNKRVYYFYKHNPERIAKIATIDPHREMLRSGIFMPYWALGWNGLFDKDNDGIKNKKDACPNEPEDIDGFEDDDGCPDPDNDNDGIMDGEDECPNEPEDFDGFKDNDGCPDPDNDNDGIPDEKDKCPNEPEDIDRFEDDDGCPDPDNDNDGIPDIVDKCPDRAEDKDGFEDNDGCPDIDNDFDTVPDSLDNCPDMAGAPENNGCPWSSSPKEIIRKGRVILRDVEFEDNSANLTYGSYETLQRVYESLLAWPETKIEITAHTDNRGLKKDNVELSQKRAEVIYDYLVKLGIDPDRMRAFGRGEAEPIATNRSQKGRKINTRIELRRFD